MEDLSRIIASKVNNMDNLFYYDLYQYSDCPENRAYVVHGDISHWDVSNAHYEKPMNATNIPLLKIGMCQIFYMQIICLMVVILIKIYPLGTQSI